MSKLIFACFLFLSPSAFCQYILNGSAQKISCNCYTLTKENNFESGSVWNSNKINLTSSFDFWFNVFLGCKNADGADGIVFILQPISTSVGAAGGGMGFEGVKPSIGIALDTWQNFEYNDPDYDHISIQANGILNHSSDLAGPVTIAPFNGDVEDCKWHVLRIVWDAAAKNLQAYFDGALRVEKQIDLVSTIFNNDPAVYWGFTGATGGSVNLQQFCTALNPIFSVNGSGSGGCVDKPVIFKDSSESFAPIVSYNWLFGDGTTSTDRNPPPHTYPAPGRYPVNLKITGKDGCEKDSTTTVTIGSIPTANLSADDACFHSEPDIHFSNNNVGVTYQWLLDGTSFSTEQQPQFGGIEVGNHRLEIVVTSVYDCGPPANAGAGFTIKPLPKIEAETENGCVEKTLRFNGLQTDNETTIAQWRWDFGDGSSTSGQNTLHQYNAAAQYPVKLWALATNGCSSDTVLSAVNVNAATVFAGRDTAIIKDLPFALHGSGNGSFLWSPAAGLSDPTIADPVVTLSRDQSFVLTVTTAEGCTANDTIRVKVFKGPAIYVPTAFTPNGDGKNETLRPVYVGIKELKQFAVFNRWGQMVFTTANMQKAWEPRDVESGTYVWLIRAVNSLDQQITLKGTTTIIR